MLLVARTHQEPHDGMQAPAVARTDKEKLDTATA